MFQAGEFALILAEITVGGWNEARCKVEDAYRTLEVEVVLCKAQ